MPRAGGGRRGGEASAEPEALHELGVRGRKTGAFLKDTGERDEHGMQPLDAIFSSPGGAETIRDESGSEDMEISSSAGPGPRTVLKNRRSIQNANDRSSSPTRNPSAEKAAVNRRLNFASKAANQVTTKTNGKHKATAVNGLSRHRDDSDSEELDDVMGMGDHGVTIDDMVEESMLMVDSMRSDPRGEDEGHSAPPSEQKKRGRPAAKGALQTKSKAAPRAPIREPSEETEPEELEEEPEEAESEQEDQEEDRRQNARQKGRPPKQDQKRREEVPPSSQPSKKRGPPRKSLRQDTPEEVQDQSVEEEEEEEEEEEDVAPRKKQRTTGPAISKTGPAKPKPSTKGKAPAVARGDIVVPVPAASKSKPKAEPKPKTKGRPGRKPKTAGASGDAEEADVGETSFAALQRGPPMPKSRGLVSMRKDLDDRITQTRSGRHSYRPVQYWRGEQVVREDEEQADMFAKDRFVMPSIKEVVRVPVEEMRSRAGAAKGKARPKPKKPMVEEEYEGWEINPGTVEGEVVIWETEHEEHPPADDEPVQVTDERIAISAKAVQTSEIRDATFRFAKTLTMPFMGAGVVDLPPGGEKRPKNSRKMHMVFFVHTGKVMVTINEAQFRISAGGMWFVPRATPSLT
ncbi:cupin [Trichoderma arundinaceum]|uniref:Cupin n=1 Tax=Trichoderma arundinaceum TaxID=490622 RepID=A0A395NSJ2_TRIAR|nr:cupin [Trichoderma arundinaceum]